MSCKKLPWTSPISYTCNALPRIILYHQFPFQCFLPSAFVSHWTNIHSIQKYIGLNIIQTLVFTYQSSKSHSISLLSKLPFCYHYAFCQVLVLKFCSHHLELKLFPYMSALISYLYYKMDFLHSWFFLYIPIAFNTVIAIFNVDPSFHHDTLSAVQLHATDSPFLCVFRKASDVSSYSTAPQNIHVCAYICNDL